MEITKHGKTYQAYTCPRCRCVFAACEMMPVKMIGAERLDGMPRMWRRNSVKRNGVVI